MCFLMVYLGSSLFWGLVLLLTAMKCGIWSNMVKLPHKILLQKVFNKVLAQQQLLTFHQKWLSDWSVETFNTSFQVGTLKWEMPGVEGKPPTRFWRRKKNLYFDQCCWSECDNIISGMRCWICVSALWTKLNLLILWCWCEYQGWDARAASARFEQSWRDLNIFILWYDKLLKLYWQKGLMQGVGFEPTQSYDYESLNLTP